MHVICVNNTETKRYGFLWLKRKQVPIVGLTLHKKYFVHNFEVSYYANTSFTYYFITDDRGIPQIYSTGYFMISSLD